MKQKTSLVGFREFRSERNLERLNRSWQYLTPPQRLWIFIRASWYAMPNILQVVEHIEYRYYNWLTYRLYKAHWLR